MIRIASFLVLVAAILAHAMFGDILVWF